MELRRRHPAASDERGQGLMEYALILSLAVVVTAASLTSLGQTIVARLYDPVSSMFP